MESELTSLLAVSSTKADDGADSNDDDIGRVYRDHPRHMTLARRMARNLSQYHWYHPRRDDVDEVQGTSSSRSAPSSTTTSSTSTSLPKLDSAWAYFEHFVLPRHFAQSEEGSKDKLQKAEPGEASAETRLYNVWSTPEKDLADMGVGIGIYFFTLRCLAIVLLLAGLINIPNLMFYNSSYYNDDESGGVPYVLQRSAICTDHHWAACPTCSLEQWDYFPRTFDRYAESADGHKFIKINTCSFGYFLGLFTWISIVFVSVALYVVCFHIIKRKEVEYDEAEQTSTDYSIAVENPPKDAHDAEKWRKFFSQFGHVTCITVAVDNEELVRALVERRGLMYQLQQLLPPDVKFDKFNLESMAEQAKPLVWWQIMMFSSTAEQLLFQINALDEKITELSELKHDVAEIFVTFETEEAQRASLRSLCVRRWDTLTNNTSGLPQQLLYGGQYILNVVEPPEPSAVRWQDLDDSLTRRLAIRFVTSVITTILIVCGMLVITYCRFKYGPAMAALAISALNTIAPLICYTLTEYESHRSEGDKQASRYFKITASMWVFTALVTAAVTPFTDTVSNSSDSILYALYAIFIFELIRGPVTQCFDVAGNLQRHLLGPRVANRLMLMGLFQGTAYELSERYTNMTSVLFLTFYYATIFPAGYFFAALTLAVHYWTDKYSLLRIWSPAPKIGTKLSVFCRSFIVVTLLVLAILSGYYVAGFPFDNACESSEVVTSDYIGDFFATVGDGREISVTIDKDENSFYFCDMDMQRYRPPAFPAWASNQPSGGEWMDADQENISWLFGWTSVFALILAGLIFLKRVVLRFVRYMFFRQYIPSGKTGAKGFSDVKEIFSYVPQVRVPGLPMPLLVCNVNNIDRELIGWDDPKHGVNAHNVLYDIPAIGEKEIFSEIKHWPPPGKN